MRKNRPTRSTATFAFRLLAMTAALAALVASHLGAQPAPGASLTELEVDADARAIAIDKILGTTSVHDYISLLNGAQCAQVRETNRRMNPDQAREALWRMVDSPAGVSWAVARGMDSEIRHRELLLRIDDYRRKYDNLKRRLAETTDAVDGPVRVARASSSGRGHCADWAENLEECGELADCPADNEHYWEDLVEEFCEEDDGHVR